jgi:hypothetical protein
MSSTMLSRCLAKQRLMVVYDGPLPNLKITGMPISLKGRRIERRCPRQGSLYSIKNSFKAGDTLIADFGLIMHKNMSYVNFSDSLSVGDILIPHQF